MFEIIAAIITIFLVSAGVGLVLIGLVVGLFSKPVRSDLDIVKERLEKIAIEEKRRREAKAKGIILLND